MGRRHHRFAATVAALLVVLLGAGGAWSLAAAAPEPTETEVRALLDRYALRFSQENVTLLRRLFTENPRYVYAGDAPTVGADSVFAIHYQALFRGGRVGFYRLSALSLTTRPGGATAVGRYRYAAHGSFHNQGLITFEILATPTGPRIQQVASVPDLYTVFTGTAAFAGRDVPAEIESTWRAKPGGTLLGRTTSRVTRAGTFEAFAPFPGRHVARMRFGDEFVVKDVIVHRDGTRTTYSTSDTYDYGG